MSKSFLQTYNLHRGQVVQKKVVEKEEVHNKNLLHLSVHLLIINSQNQILIRKRTANDIRYADLWTSSVGTHVLLNNDYELTLRELLPVRKKMEYIGEFRVSDRWENEINGLYVLKEDRDDLSEDFLKDKKFFTINDLKDLIKKNKTTPHLKEGLRLLLKKYF